MSIGIIVSARKGSGRLPNKLLRPFADSTLFEVFLDKLKKFRDIVYIAVGEQEFIDIAKREGFNCILRNKESVTSDATHKIWNYLDTVSFDWIFAINPCHPFLKSSTIQAALDIVDKNSDDPNFGGLFAVRECPLMIWDSERKIINKDVGIYDSKARKPSYIAADVITIYRRLFFLETGAYWYFTKLHPKLFNTFSKALAISSISFSVAGGLTINVKNNSLLYNISVIGQDPLL